MIPVDFPQRNALFTRPDDMTDEECGDLPVWRGGLRRLHTDEPPIPALVSMWQPSKEDIEAIVAGKPIVLTIVTMGRPPVSLSTESPFEQPNLQFC